MLPTAEQAIEPQELKADRKAPQRSCIVTRESQDKEGLIRFAIGPDSVLTPDLSGKLPGRGYWVTCAKTILEKAIKEKRFLKIAKEPVKVQEALTEQVENLLQERALQFLSLANKAGEVIFGFEKVADALKSDKVIALLHAQGASEDSIQKLSISPENRLQCFPVEALSIRLGAENAVHVALIKGKAAEAALKEIRRFTGFLES